MIVSVNWLKDYVDVNVPVSEFCDRMIMSGSNLETCTEIGCGISGVVIGRIDKIEQHPDADKLVVCQINVGGEAPVQIVTGADNVFEGAFVPVAMDGSHIPGPLHGQPKVEGGVDIHKGSLRGVESIGMLCSAQELGYDDKVAPMFSKDGIWILPGNWDDHLGEEITDALELKDSVIDFEITPNRPDCLSMLGMAREAAATFGEKMRYPDTECEKTDEQASDYISAEIRSPLCKRYTARIIKDVRVEQSPWWLQKRLMAAGMRPINNMVDITNFVMLEYGQPMHAFDIKSLAGAKIIVDTAKEGEVFTTLDGVERVLEDDMLMINDAEKPVGVAGIMGGLNSEILPDTNTVVIESANFLGSSVRMTAKKLGLRTEASGRYEKGIDPNLCEAAADRVCKLVELLDCGKVVDGSIDVYPEPVHAPVVTARVSRINKVLGTDIPREQMVGYLESLEMKVEGEGDEMIVTPPTVRQDLLEEVDYVEEVARMYGYDNLPMTLPDTASSARFPEDWDLRVLTRRTLCGMGANEIQTYSFSNNKILDKLQIPEDSIERNFVEIINPMGEDTSALRTILMPGMLDVLSRNYARNIPGLRAYEMGIVFMKNLMEEHALPDESYNLCIGCYGEGETFFTLKGMIQALLDKLGVKNLRFVTESEYGLYHPGRCARIQTIGKFGEEVELGIMGEVHPDVAENYGIGTRVYTAELFFDTIVEFSDREVVYQHPPIYPSTSRDMALIVDEDLEIGRIEEAVKAMEADILEDIQLFDVYRGIQVGRNKKSVAFSLTYRDNTKTLTDKEVDSVQEQVVAMLAEKFGAALRD
ncbi:MAG: phenylalanine--tRNA ligase subunit beta [Eubacterium sp.]|nr:phenylalanine--tRNA ligase subunit beta [Eubacterium sp.]